MCFNFQLNWEDVTDLAEEVVTNEHKQLSVSWDCLAVKGAFPKAWQSDLITVIHYGRRRGLILESRALISSLPHLCYHMCACTDVHTCINKSQFKCFYSTRILITLDAVSHNSVIQKIAVEAWTMNVPHSLWHLNARFSVGDPVW